MTERAMAGFVLAAAIASLAWRVRWLSRSGAVAATLIGALSVAASWQWGALLIWFFVSSSLLTRWRSRVKVGRTRGVVEKAGARDAAQVMANGALFALSGVLGAWTGSTLWQAFGLGSLATAAADTFATEVGTALSATPRFILGGTRVAAGTSGAVSGIGTLASLAGGGAIGGAALAMGWPAAVAAIVVAAGVIGAFADTVMGATVQERRQCHRCHQATELRVHECGAATAHAGGIGGFRNDLVNVTSGALGGLIAATAMLARR